MEVFFFYSVFVVIIHIITSTGILHIPEHVCYKNTTKVLLASVQVCLH